MKHQEKEEIPSSPTVLGQSLFNGKTFSLNSKTKTRNMKEGVDLGSRIIRVESTETITDTISTSTIKEEITSEINPNQAVMESTTSNMDHMETTTIVISISNTITNTMVALVISSNRDINNEVKCTINRTKIKIK
jgi:hypothetical protein